MICFDVYINGERFCLAGREDLSVLSTVVDMINPQDSNEVDMTINVGGFYREVDSNIHPSWLDRMPLKIGDEITLRIVESDAPDQHLRETRSTAQSEADLEREYYEKLKAKSEGEQS